MLCKTAARGLGNSFAVWIGRNYLRQTMDLNSVCPVHMFNISNKNSVDLFTYFACIGLDLPSLSVPTGTFESLWEQWAQTNLLSLFFFAVTKTLMPPRRSHELCEPAEGQQHFAHSKFLCGRKVLVTPSAGSLSHWHHPVRDYWTRFQEPWADGKYQLLVLLLPMCMPRFAQCSQYLIGSL